MYQLLSHGILPYSLKFKRRFTLRPGILRDINGSRDREMEYFKTGEALIAPQAILASLLLVILGLFLIFGGPTLIWIFVIVSLVNYGFAWWQFTLRYLIKKEKKLQKKLYIEMYG